MIDDLQQVTTPWFASVKDGAFYTFAMKSPMMHVYATYSKSSKRLLLSIEQPIYARTGQVAAIAVVHLTDEDLDGLPDSALYACHYLDPQGRLIGASNIPSEIPTKNDLYAWHDWLRVLIDELNDHIEKMDLYDPDG